MSKHVAQAIKDLYKYLNVDELVDVARFLYGILLKKRVRPRDVFGYNEGIENFDIDLIDGKYGESEFANLFKEGKIEIKRDHWVSRSGNVAIEFECFGKPSGITTTKAEFWALVLNGSEYAGEVIICITTQRLRKLTKGCEIKATGDGKSARCYMLPVQELVKRGC